MRKTVPDFVFSRFQRVGSVAPVGVLSLVVSTKELARLRDMVVQVATTARSRREPGECPQAASKRAISIHKYDGFPDMCLEIELSPEGWEIEYLIALAGQQALDAIEATPPRNPDISWISNFSEVLRNSETKPVKWTLEKAYLFRCGEDWLISIMPVLQRAAARALGELREEDFRSKKTKKSAKGPRRERV